MKTEFDRDQVTKALHRVGAVVEKKTTMPILGNVLVEAKNDRLFFSATDLEIGIQSSCPAKVLEEGRVCIPARSLIEIIKELPERTGKLRKGENEWLILESGKALFRVVGMTADEFPQMLSEDQFSFEKVGNDTFRSSIEKTFFAISTDEMRYNLNGAFLETQKGDKGKTVLRMVATDGHRLAMVDRELAANEKISLKKGVILPRKGVVELKRLLTENEEGKVEVAVVDANAAFRLADTVLFMRLVVGEFPDYGAVIPKGNKKRLMMKRELFAKALKRVSILSEGKSKCIRLDIRGDGVHLSATSPELGEAEEDVPGEFDGGKLEIGFNARYLLDALLAIGGENILLELGHEQSPGILRNPDDRSFLGVVMPMRL